MADTCPLCGAKLNDSISCELIFNQFLSLEFANTAFGKVHFLTVACYMIQHQLYSDEGLIWIEEQLRAYFEEGITTDQIRNQNRLNLSQSQRKWKVVRDSLTPQTKIQNWSMTIVDVANQYDGPVSYCELISKWAKFTLEEMRSILPTTKKDP